jgi:hypothetical protein
MKPLSTSPLTASPEISGKRHTAEPGPTLEEAEVERQRSLETETTSLHERMERLAASPEEEALWQQQDHLQQAGLGVQSPLEGVYHD